MTLAVVVALAGAGCGDDGDGGDDAVDDAPTSSTTTDVPALGETEGEGACALLGTDEITEVLDAEAEPELTEDTSPEASMAYSFCRWDAGGGYIDVSVIESPERFSGRREALQEDHEKNDGPEPRPVEDLGDDAFVVTAIDAIGPQQSVSILVGERTVEVNLGQDGDGAADLAVDLGRRVVSRLED